MITDELTYKIERGKDLENELMVDGGKGSLGSLRRSRTHCYIQNG